MINIDTNNIWNNQTQTFECTEEKQCTSSVINCPSHRTCVVNCKAEISNHLEGGVCAASIINCPTDGDCIIICDGHYACQGAILNGPTNREFGIICADWWACYESQIHAEKASYFNFTMKPTDTSTARGISIWFPPRTKSFIRSYITAMGNGLNGLYGYIPLHFYALNGFEDVEIDYRGDYDGHGGVMHCHDGYLDSCWFADDSYSCNDRNTICDFATRSPTIYPSESPIIESTAIPTTISTITPTSSTISPTDIPTIQPSNQTMQSLWKYTVGIVITFTYEKVSNLTSIQIDRILPNITRNIVDSIIPLTNCIQKDGYIIIVVNTINITQIEVQILACNEEIGDKLVTTLRNSSFEDDIIDET